MSFKIRDRVKITNEKYSVYIGEHGTVTDKIGKLFEVKLDVPVGGRDTFTFEAKNLEIIPPVPSEFPQEQEKNEYRYLSPSWLNEIATGLTAGAVKYPGETWRQIPCEEHLARALRHINLYLMGDRSEKHLINAAMRIMMSFETSEKESTK